MTIIFSYSFIQFSNFSVREGTRRTQTVTLRHSETHADFYRELKDNIQTMISLDLMKYVVLGKSNSQLIYLYLCQMSYKLPLNRMAIKRIKSNTLLNKPPCMTMILLLMQCESGSQL